MKKGAGRGKKLLSVLLAVNLMCTACNGQTATVMKLMKTEGTVGVSNEEGTSITLSENMNLYSGYQMETKEQSYAWINLDSVKLTKMDAASEIKIQKEGKHLEIQVLSGGLFFHVTEPLDEEEALNIRTSTMSVGIRGTCGWILVEDETHMYVYILEGTVECSVTDPESGANRTEEVSSGEKAELILHPETSKDGTCEIIKDPFEEHEIPVYVWKELLQDEKLSEKIREDSGLEIPADGSVPGYVDMGRQYLEGGNYESAIQILSDALETDPGLAEAYVLRGDAVILSKETQENLEAAQADYESALGLDAAEAGAYLGLADIGIRHRDYDGAQEILENGLVKTGGDGEIADKLTELENGNIVDSGNKARRLSGYDESGSLVWYHEYSYNEDGEQIRAESYDGSGMETGAVDVRYDGEGRQVQGYAYGTENGIIDTRVGFSRNENGNVVRTDYYNMDGELRDYMLCEYDGSGNRVRESHYNLDGAMNSYSVMEYDGAGNLLRMEHFGSDETLAGYFTYKYDENGRMSSMSSYNKNGELEWQEIYEYDPDGSRIGVQRL